MEPDDLASLHSDMVAFIEGHGMKRFHAYVNEEVNSIAWDPGDNPDSWKDFVETAKAAGASFLTMNSFVLDRTDLEYLSDRLRQSQFGSPEDFEEARWLRSYVGKTGFVQLGFPFQGVLFLFESSTHWYEHYQRLVDLSEECDGIAIDEPDQDDER